CHCRAHACMARRAGHGGQLAAGGAQFRAPGTRFASARGKLGGGRAVGANDAYPGSRLTFQGFLMDILYVLIPLSVGLVLLVLLGLWWAVYRGQFENVDQEAERILREN